jgi:hypothetical protein
MLFLISTPEIENGECEVKPQINGDICKNHVRNNYSI